MCILKAQTSWLLHSEFFGTWKLRNGVKAVTTYGQNIAIHHVFNAFSTAPGVSTHLSYDSEEINLQSAACRPSDKEQSALMRIVAEYLAGHLSTFLPHSMTSTFAEANVRCKVSIYERYLHLLASWNEHILNRLAMLTLWKCYERLRKCIVSVKLSLFWYYMTWYYYILYIYIYMIWVFICKKVSFVDFSFSCLTLHVANLSQLSNFKLPGPIHGLWPVSALPAVAAAIRQFGEVPAMPQVAARLLKVLQLRPRPCLERNLSDIATSEALDSYCSCNAAKNRRLSRSPRRGNRLFLDAFGPL